METVTHGEFLEWKKTNPITDSTAWSIQKDVKFYDEVYMAFSNDGKPHKCYLLQRGKRSPWGDIVELFFPKKSGIFYKGVKEFWIQDIGLGKTAKEAQANYMKFNWIQRNKRDLQHHVFFSLKLERLENAE